jgi:hypothetical protein
MWTLLALFGCPNPAPPDELAALRTWANARCRLVVSDTCRSNGASCYPEVDPEITRAACLQDELFRWSSCDGAPAAVTTESIADCVRLLRTFDCDAPCDGDAFAFDGDACADVLAALEATCDP